MKQKFERRNKFRTCAGMPSKRSAAMGTREPVASPQLWEQAGFRPARTYFTNGRCNFQRWCLDVKSRPFGEAV